RPRTDTRRSPALFPPKEMKRQGHCCPCLPLCRHAPLCSDPLRDVLLDVLGGVADGLDPLCLFVRDLHPELLLEAHDELDEIEGVGVQVVHEGRLGLYIALVHPELLNDDLLELLVGLCFRQTGYLLRVSGLPGRLRTARQSVMACRKACPSGVADDKERMALVTR